jgi:hypothetical protein
VLSDDQRRNVKLVLFGAAAVVFVGAAILAELGAGIRGRGMGLVCLGALLRD